MIFLDVLQTQLEIDKALEADPTVYDYDNIYDSMKAQVEEKNAAIKQKADKKVINRSKTFIAPKLNLLLNIN